MQTFNTILAAVDFSDNSDCAFRLAMTLARQFDSRLIILHVIDNTVDVRGFYIPHPSLEQLEIEFKKSAAAMMSAFCRKELGDFSNISTSIACGVPYKEIICTAEESTASLIVLGTHGRSGFDRLAFGSTAERVVRRASCPVLTVPFSTHHT